ncbi:MFS transporter [Brenneria izadpanahii]|uniref:MFS transporter n=1 Tax=Brenneria izadpanahii TaxID=2722756 RepID=A0ABX7UXP2_9GAMM|nr:MFS transporter [Brenneria izadpanahii]QTF10589.1 MFS transporter [Brenneria izadpanahii]
MVMGGITVATIIGVPLGIWLGHYGGFRLAFGFVAVLGLVAIMGLALWLPALRMPSAIDFKERIQSLLIPGVPGILAVTALAMTAGFTVYIYMGPQLASTLHADENTLGMVLMVFGIAGTPGNMLSGWLFAANRLCEMTHAPFEVSPLIVYGVFHYHFIRIPSLTFAYELKSAVIGSWRSP